MYRPAYRSHVARLVRETFSRSPTRNPSCTSVAKGALMTPADLLILVWIIAVGLVNAREDEDLGL